MKIKGNPLLFFAVLFFVHGFIYSQDYPFPPDTYRSPANPYYWQNRAPSKSYWQQDVHYKILARLNDSLNIIDGDETLNYWNNSPDTLPYVYFHLYSNAQNKHSYYTSLSVNNGYYPAFGKYEAEDSGCAVKSITMNGIALKTELDNTVLKVYLNKPVYPGQNVSFHIMFRTYFDQGGNRNRMKMFVAWQNKRGDTVLKHFDCVHFYPRICVYDTKFGWDVQQHLAHEFYGDYGCYDVAFTLPNNYVVAATGNLLNEDEMLPDTLMRKLDIRNFAHKRYNSAPSIVIPRNRTTKTWLFHAENVHDFALTADPTYRIARAEWHGIKCYGFAEEMHAAGWQNSALYTAAVIACNSKFFGMFAYPKMIVADARDGMEYPMLTLDGGFDPDYRSLLTHEISHNWFFGMVGNNETYRAALDEGFTEFVECWTYKELNGKNLLEYPPLNKYARRFSKPSSIRMVYTYLGYLNNQLSGFNDVTLNTSSDDYHSALGHGGGYGQVYFKTATMLYNLQYMLGDSLFFAAMQHYFNQWKFCHPYLNDFRNSVTSFVHTDLTWFFDEWLNTSKNLDYGIKRIKKAKGKNKYIIRFVRKGGMQMPIDFTVVSKSDSVFNYYIPNGWFEKKTGATILPRWIGWGKIQPEYDAAVTIPNGIKSVTIDTSRRLADINMLNNSKPFPVKTYFDSKIYNIPDWTNYEAFVGPSLWYNGYDGLQLGFHVNGDYMQTMHKLNATLLFNTGFFQNLPHSTPNINLHEPLAFTLNYQTPTGNFIRNSSVDIYGQSANGLDEGKINFQVQDNSRKNTFYVKLEALYIPHAWDTNYLLYPRLWQTGVMNNTITAGILHEYRYSPSGSGTVDLHFCTSVLTTSYSYSQTTFTWLNKQQLGKRLDLHLRLFGQYGTGTLVPYESELYAAGANPLALEDNPFAAAQGIVPAAWTGYGNAENHFQEGGGLNLRGYAGYLVPELDANKNLIYAYNGNTGAAINGELDFNRLLHLKKPLFRNDFALATYLFGDAGYISISQTNSPTIQFSSLRADAGVGVALTIQRWGPLQKCKPLTIRFDMPLFLNEPPYNENYFQWRWVIGIGRCF